MTSIEDPGRRVAAHFRLEAPPRAPDGLLASTLAIIETTPQRRALRRLVGLPRPPWRFPIVNMFAKLAIAAAAVVVGVVAVGGFLGADLPGIGAAPPAATPSPTAIASHSPSPAPTSSPTPSPTVAPAPTFIGALTLSETDCVWNGSPNPLPAGRIRLDYVNTTGGDLGKFGLFRIEAGHSYQELVDFWAMADQGAQEGHTMPPLPDGISDVARTAPSPDNGSLTALVTAGTYAPVCVRGDAATGQVLNFFLGGPIEFK